MILLSDTPPRLDGRKAGTIGNTVLTVTFYQHFVASMPNDQCDFLVGNCADGQNRTQRVLGWTFGKLQIRDDSGFITERKVKPKRSTP
jgi:hypothetical protein